MGKWFWIFPLLLAGFCFWQGFSGEGRAVTPPVAEQQQPHLKTTPIRKLQTSMRVIGENPELLDESIEVLQIQDPTQWRNVRLLMTKPDESLLKVTLLRQLEWLDLNQAKVGSIVELDMPELGAAGPAEVLAIEPCPDIEPGNRPLITGTFEHTAANVIDLAIESEAAPIGTTDNHPFWSEDRQTFVEAGQLKIGETLSLADGRTTRVTSIIPRAGPQTVYNLEVSGEHVYHVGNTGVLLHNTYGGRVGYTDDAYGKGYDRIFSGKGAPGTQRWLSKTTKSGRPYKKPGPKTDLDAPHNKKIQSIIDEQIAKGQEHIGGGNLTEAIVPTPGGIKPVRRMDASFRDPTTGKVTHFNVGLKNVRGDPIIRERRALDDVINHSAGFKTDFIIKFREYLP